MGQGGSMGKDVMGQRGQHEGGVNGLGGSSREVLMGQNRGEDLHAG